MSVKGCCKQRTWLHTAAQQYEGPPKPHGFGGPTFFLRITKGDKLENDVSMTRLNIRRPTAVFPTSDWLTVSIWRIAQ